jgi:hypothetical protein
MFNSLCHLTVPNRQCHVPHYDRNKREVYVTQVVNNDYVTRCEYTCSVGVLHFEVVQLYKASELLPERSRKTTQK